MKPLALPRWNGQFMTCYPAKRKPLSGQLRTRTWKNVNGIEYQDHVCLACLAIVPDPKRGCQHCVARAAKQEANFTAFLQTKQED